eukprot:scaffold149431_cov36-Cyclotella_meneghiniana.AAC.1
MLESHWQKVRQAGILASMLHLVLGFATGMDKIIAHQQSQSGCINNVLLPWCNWSDAAAMKGTMDILMGYAYYVIQKWFKKSVYEIQRAAMLLY